MPRPFCILLKLLSVRAEPNERRTISKVREQKNMLDGRFEIARDTDGETV